MWMQCQVARKLVKGWQKKSKRASFQREMACPDFLLTKKSARNGFAEIARIIHHVLLEHLQSPTLSPQTGFWLTFDDDSKIMHEAEMSNCYRSRLVQTYPTISYIESSKVSQNRS